MISMHRRWEAFKGDKIQEIVFTVKKSSIFQLKTALDVFLVSNTDQKVRDFHVEGSYFDRQCTILQGDRVVAEMKREFTMRNELLKNRFAVMVEAGVDCAFIVALVIILDEISTIYETSGEELLKEQFKTRIGDQMVL
ncbi:hypothetical protein KI387_037754 [Taxus chinensis]|uniref:Uncharacterized protein n=1 Tax=Taxus chinensis TaxID=29808 RepID=A0AA38KTH2_TAXCH|nr:hypothetical protein KI387_037754 [Taxus chinensis]